MSTRLTMAVLAGVVLPVTLCIAVYGSVIEKRIDERLPPRKTLPEIIYWDPVMEGLKGWKKFGYLTFKGKKDGALKAAAKWGAEAVDVKEKDISSGGGTALTYKGSMHHSYGTEDIYKWESQEVKFSKAYYMQLFRRVKPDAQHALDSICTYWVDEEGGHYSSSDTTTLKQILALGRVDLNSFSGDTTALYRVVSRIVYEMGTGNEDPVLDVKSRDISDWMDSVGFLLAEGADPNIRCGEKRDTIPQDLVPSALRWSIERYGDFSARIEKFTDWRELGRAPMTAGHNQAALLELKGMLAMGGGAVKGPEKTAAQSPKKGAVKPEKPSAPRKAKRYDAAPPMTIDKQKQYTATLETMKGSMVFNLFAKDAPVSVNNFVFLAREGYYDGTMFNRIFQLTYIRGGDPDPFSYEPGGGGPGYDIPPERSPRKHDAGALVMQYVGSEGSSSQFYITYSPQPHLDQYENTVFGQLTSGMDVLKKLIEGDVILGITIQEK